MALERIGIEITGGARRLGLAVRLDEDALARHPGAPQHRRDRRRLAGTPLPGHRPGGGASTAPRGPPAAAPTASPVTAPMSDCFEPSLRSSPQAYAGQAAAAPASATPSTPARIVDANVVMLPPVPRVRNALVPVRSTVHRTHASRP